MKQFSLGLHKNVSYHALCVNGLRQLTMVETDRIPPQKRVLESRLPLNWLLAADDWVNSAIIVGDSSDPFDARPIVHVPVCWSPTQACRVLCSRL
jgi:hypothetical protein